MYKIEFIQTGHIFCLPDETAKDLKSRYPNDYKILEKNGKAFRDRLKPLKKMDSKSIKYKVLEED